MVVGWNKINHEGRRKEDDSSHKLSKFNVPSLEIFVFIFLSNFDLYNEKEGRRKKMY